MSMEPIPTPRELAEEALRALRSSQQTPRELIQALIQAGIIDEKGRVLVNRLFGDGPPQDEPAPRTPSTPAANGTPTGQDVEST